MRRSFRALGADARAIALVEFALVLPVALTMYIGGMQLQDGIACNRKVTIATRTIADLVAQNQTGLVTADEIDSDLAATTQVLAPYASSAAEIRISEVYTDWARRTTVQWSRSINGAPYSEGSSASIPSGMRIPGTYFLIAEIKYAYTPLSSFGLIGPMTLKDSLIMLPRNSAQVDCSDC